MKIKVFWENKKIFLGDYELKNCCFYGEFAVAIDDRNDEIITFYKGTNIQPIHYKLIDKKLFKEINYSIKYSLPITLEKYIESYATLKGVPPTKFIREVPVVKKKVVAPSASKKRVIKVKRKMK
jgi:hypothetical protein